MKEQRKEALEYIINKKQIKTVFQPIISIRDGVILGYEALSRITCDSEINNPEDLFKIAREFNYLWDLELLCRTKALESAYKFMIPPFNKKLFINVNPNIMHDESFKKGFTKEFLKQYTIIPQNIIFEITERNVIEDLIGFKSTVSHYKSQEYNIAIDDVGSGYSGLNLISDVAPDYIKLDMLLIRNIHIDKIKYALVKGMVEFSKASNIKLIAEGIETYEELETIINLGVQYGQGYFIQKPDSVVKEISNDVLQAILDINIKKNQSERDCIFNTSIRNLCETTEIISPNVTIPKVYDIMKKNPGCFGLCIIDNDVPIGIITKDKLTLCLSGQYGYTLNQNKPISVIMDTNFLSVDCKTPVNIVASIAMSRPTEKIYDFIVVTEDNKYLGTVTIKNLLQKSIEIEISTAKHQNPLSGLPGNLMIEHKLNHYIDSNSKFSAAYLDIDNFKAYNDIYGFENGDLVIKLLSDILRNNISYDQFVGHVGGDDFLVILEDHKTENDFINIVRQFESEVLAFYNQKDIQNGYITTRNRSGKIERFPLITLTVAVINNRSQTFNNAVEISSILAGLKISIKRNKSKKVGLSKIQ
ncbi:MAG: diguanylate cyclase/phosphodiesterase [Fusobacteria bacterium]|nr:MAG: diguanylate cyclase/phosphodiesterase [Fusobacteriota bacterium]KAF0229098.1 MAG: diguanylate [Fusobacteriota bacterium]